MVIAISGTMVEAPTCTGKGLHYLHMLCHLNFGSLVSNLVASYAFDMHMSSVTADHDNVPQLIINAYDLTCK